MQASFANGSKRFCKRQQMQSSKRGAHVLLQTRVTTLKRELGSMFQRWYPDLEVEELPDTASSPASPCAREADAPQGPGSLTRS